MHNILWLFYIFCGIYLVFGWHIFLMAD